MPVGSEYVCKCVVCVCMCECAVWCVCVREIVCGVGVWEVGDEG